MLGIMSALSWEGGGTLPLVEEDEGVVSVFLRANIDDQPANLIWPMSV
jgi:hypothetical protein